MSARAFAMARTSAPGSSGPNARRDRPCAMAERTSSRLATLFDAGTRTRLSTREWRTGAIGWMSCTGCEDYVRKLYVHARRATRSGGRRDGRAHLRHRGRWLHLAWRAGRGWHRREPDTRGVTEHQSAGREVHAGHELYADGSVDARDLGVEREGAEGRVPARPGPGLSMRDIARCVGDERGAQLPRADPRRDGLHGDALPHGRSRHVPLRPEVQDDGRQADGR